MNRINLLDVKEIQSKSTPLMNETSILVMNNGSTVIVPRPVMIGLALFVHAAYGGVSQETVLTYDSFQFYIPGPIDYDQYLGLMPFYKYLADHRLEKMSKVYIREYSKLEHFYRRKNERIPVEVDGYQTRLVVKPHNPVLLECELDIEQRQIRNDLMRGYNTMISEVFPLNKQTDQDWWSRPQAVQ